jgi:hypothetical protein
MRGNWGRACARNDGVCTVDASHILIRKALLGNQAHSPRQWRSRVALDPLRMERIERIPVPISESTKAQCDPIVLVLEAPMRHSRARIAIPSPIFVFIAWKRPHKPEWPQDSVSRIESNACSVSSLQSIVIPSNVEILGSSCFADWGVRDSDEENDITF